LNSLNAESWRRAWYRFRRNRLSVFGLGLVLLVLLAAIFAPYLAPYPEDAGSVVKFAQAHRPPCGRFWFGTDEVGRDILSRVIFGSRISLALGVLVLTIAAGVGVPLGLIAGYWGGTAGAVIMRVTDTFLAIPPLVLALAVSAVLPPSFVTTMVAIAFAWWPWYARLVHGEVLSVREEQYVQAAETVGASRWRVAFVEIMPNCLAPVIVKLTLDMGFVILMGAVLSFLGLGVQPPKPAWGTMIAEGRVYLPANWWGVTLPGLAIFVTVMGFNLLGDGLRDVLDVEVERWN